MIGGYKGYFFLVFREGCAVTGHIIWKLYDGSLSPCPTRGGVWGLYADTGSRPETKDRHRTEAEKTPGSTPDRVSPIGEVRVLMNISLGVDVGSTTAKIVVLR